MSEVKNDESTDIVEKQTGALVDPDLMGMFDEDAGSGFEDTSSDDYRIPYVRIAQALSPQIDSSDDQYIPGLEKGMIFDNVSGEFYDEIEFVIAKFDHNHVEWVPNQGGFVGVHSVAEDLLSTTTRDDKNRDMLPNGNELIDTRYLYVLIKGDNGDFNPAVISFAKTGSKTVKTIMSRARNLRITKADGTKISAPLYSHVWKLGTAVAQNNDGQKYHTWRIEGSPQLCNDVQVIRAAIELRDAVNRGERGAVEDEVEKTIDPDDVSF